MHALTRPVIFVLLFTSVFSASAQSQPQEAKQPTASITGKVTVGGKPAAGVIITLTESNPDSLRRSGGRYSSDQMVKTTTDEEGRYRLENIAAGRYLINPFAPALIIENERYTTSAPGRIINVNDGEARENIDFTLKRGGVITGRVTDADGRPVIGVEVKLTIINESTNKPEIDSMLQYSPERWFMYMTDDRGIYRIYGLPARRYVASVGAAEGEPVYGRKGRYNVQTFHPGVTDKTKATILELKEGGEVTGADIRLGLTSQTYNASGRIVDADTGKPIPVAVANFGTTDGKTKEVRSSGPNTLANSKGEFKISSLAPGHYYVFASFDEENNSYSDLTTFEITSGDVTGLVVKAHQGHNISGIVSIEGTNDPETLASLSQLELYAADAGSDRYPRNKLASKIAPDGSFRISGVQPGKVHIYVNRFSVSTKLTVLRIERNGVVQPEGIQVSADENPSDIRIILAKSGGVVRGQLNFIGGSMPDNVNLVVDAQRVDGNSFARVGQVEVDAIGRFKFEDMLPGEYEIEIFNTGDKWLMTDKDNRRVFELKQVVTVTNETEASVTFTVGFKRRKDE
jgi:protocatechuate 3,4-dioxygenase beta subunit